MLYPCCFSNTKIRHSDNSCHCKREVKSHVPLQYLKPLVHQWAQFKTSEVYNHCTSLLFSRCQKTGVLPWDNAALRARQGFKSTEYLTKWTILVKVRILLFVSQLNVDALIDAKYIPLAPAPSFSLLAQATLYNVIASLDKYPALVELTCTPNMPARQHRWTESRRVATDKAWVCIQDVILLWASKPAFHLKILRCSIGSRGNITQLGYTFWNPLKDKRSYAGAVLTQISKITYL